MEYQIQPHTRHCSVTGREITPGEKFFSVLVEEDNQFVRRDFCSNAWPGPPANAFSFWVGKMPAEATARRPIIDDDLLLDCFHRLEGQTEDHKVNFRYVVALLLMRRKRLKFEDARLDNGTEMLILRSTRDKGTYEVANPRLTEDEILAVQDEVFKVLGWN